MFHQLYSLYGILICFLKKINASLPSSSSSPSQSPILVDVREPAELVSTGIIPGAVAIPLVSQPDALSLPPDEFEERLGFPKPGFEEGASPTQPLVFYCKAGIRAKAAAQLAEEAGYDPSRIGVYTGSWLDWEKNGGKSERWEE